jgi:hypothetical protein
VNNPSLVQQFRDDLRRTVDRLSSMALDRLERVDASGLSVADRTHGLAQRFVEATAELSPTGYVAPVLPRLRSHGAAAQLAVVGRDLVIAAELCGETGDGALCDAAGALRDLRVNHL